MPGIAYLILGGVLMALGALATYAWLGGKGRFFDSGVVDRQAAGKMDIVSVCLILLNFVALVLAPLLAGALLIVFGLRKL